MECLELRSKWLSKPAVSPEQRRKEPEAVTPRDVDPNPLEYKPIPATSHTFEMKGGVIRVYANEHSGQEVFPVPGTASDFFGELRQAAVMSAMMYLVAPPQCAPPFAKAAYDCVISQIYVNPLQQGI